MPKSFELAKILSRLGIRGTVLSTSGAEPGKYQGAVPMLGPDNKLDPSVIGAGSVSLGDVLAEDVTFDVALEEDPSVTNVRDALNNITKDTGGLALMRAKNLSDLADPDASFNEIKLKATVTSGGAVVAGTVGVAGQTEVEAGTDTSADGALTGVLLTVSPSTAKTTYVSKVSNVTQVMAAALQLPGNPASALHAAPKQYVDAQVGAVLTLPTGNQLWVDAVNGSDATGTRGMSAKPFLTLAAARTAAQSGDVIVVRPGTYNENNLGKNGVSWYFFPGAKIYYTSGGDSTIAVFHVASNETCNVAGYGEFYNMHASSASRYVLNVLSGGKTTFECNWIQSARTAIYVDCGDTGYARVIVRDSLRSDDLSSGGSCAARLITGNCTLDVGREIYSSGSQYQSGVEFGSGSIAPTGVGIQIVRCPRIIGAYNAVHFNGTVRSHVETMTCYASAGPAVKVSAGLDNYLQVTGDLRTTSVSHHAILMTRGRLSCNSTVLYALNGQAGIQMNGTPYDTASPYLILNNCQIWAANNTATAVAANNVGYFKLRIVGDVQSDCAEPTDVVRVGGAWDYVPDTES